jgi:hypothetical protein
MTTAERAKAMLGDRRIKVLPDREGFVLIEGTPIQGNEVWWVMHPASRQCCCPAFQNSKDSVKSCKHTLLMADVLPLAQVLKDAGVLG